MENSKKDKNVVSGYEGLDYRTFIERLKSELGTFLRYADRGSVVPYAGLKARSQSKKIERLLLMYRKLSRDTDRRNKSILKEAKEEIKILTTIK